MCSSTSSSAGGYGGAIPGFGGADDYGLKKFKRQRVPRRGPGVAELEKILREQETQFDDEKKGKTGGGFSSSCLVPSPSNAFHAAPQPSFMSPSISLPPGNVSFLPDHADFTPFLPALNGNGNGNGDRDVIGNSNGNSNGNGGSNGLYIAGSGLVLPEKALTPVPQGINMEGPQVAARLPFAAYLRNQTDQTQIFPPLPIAPEKYRQFQQPPMMNFFPQTAFSYASVVPLSAGMYHHVEPPSNQRPHQTCNSAWLEEDKTASAKRQRTFYDASSFSKNHAIFNSRKSFRDTTSANHLELKMKRPFIDGGESSGNTFIFASAAAPFPSSQICQQEFSRFKLFPFQEACQDSHGRTEPEGFNYQKPFCTFIFGEEQISAAQTPLTSNNEKSESRDGIDLNLKL